MSDERDGQLEIVPAAIPTRLIDEGDGVAATADGGMPVLTADMVRNTLEHARRLPRPPVLSRGSFSDNGDAAGRQLKSPG